MENIDLNKNEAQDNKMVEEQPKLTAKEEKKFVKVIIGEKSYLIPREMVAELSKREYKIEDKPKKVANAEVAILYLRESGVADLKYVKPENNMFIVDGRYYHIKDACIYTIGKKRTPLAVIPEWSFVPLSKAGYRVKLGAEHQEAQTLIIKSLENAEIVKISQDLNPKKSTPSGKLIVGIIIAAIVVIYVLSKGAS